MILERINNDFKEYPYEGKFTRSFIDESKPLDERVEEFIEILSTECDIQEASHTGSGNFIKASFEVYFPISDTIKVKNGDLFEGEFEGLVVNGRVIGIFPTQLKGCKCYIDDTDV